MRERNLKLQPCYYYSTTYRLLNKIRGVKAKKQLNTWRFVGLHATFIVIPDEEVLSARVKGSFFKKFHLSCERLLMGSPRHLNSSEVITSDIALGVAPIF